MRRWMTSDPLLLLALCGIGLAACGSSGGSPTDGGPDGPGGTTTAPCTLNYVALAGDVDGQLVAVQVVETSFLFQQGSLPHTFDVGYEGGMLHIEWTSLLPTDAPAVPATGTIVMPAGAPHAAETLCAGSGSIREHDLDGTGFHVNQIFTLGTLSIGPACPGAALAGSINGCVGG